MLHRDENKNELPLLRGDAAEVFATENLSARVSNRAKGDTEEMDYYGDIRVRTKFADGSGTEDENGNEDGVGDLKEWSKAKSDMSHDHG